MLLAVQQVMGGVEFLVSAQPDQIFYLVEREYHIPSGNAKHFTQKLLITNRLSSYSRLVSDRDEFAGPRRCQNLKLTKRSSFVRSRVTTINCSPLNSSLSPILCRQTSSCSHHDRSSTPASGELSLPRPDR